MLIYCPPRQFGQRPNPTSFLQYNPVRSGGLFVCLFFLPLISFGFILFANSRKNMSVVIFMAPRGSLLNQTPANSWPSNGSCCLAVVERALWISNTTNLSSIGP